MKVTVRIYKHPSGEAWSPELEEALCILEAAGQIYVDKDKVVLLENKKYSKKVDETR